MINYHFKGLYKTTCNKAKSTFSQFFLSSLSVERIVKYEKLIWFHHQISLYVKMDKI